MSRPACPECEGPEFPVTRREFVRVVSAGAVAATAAPLAGLARGEEKQAPASESLVKQLFNLLTPAQKEQICFPWDHTDDRGLLRTHVSNNWNITDLNLAVGKNFFTSDQQDLIRQIFFGLYNPDWKERILKQLKDDAGGYGKEQTIAIFGEPGTGKFEFVMTGRHLTIRCDGDSAEHVAFGGPIFYGHAANEQFNEPVGHPGNVFWHQAQKANKLFQMLDGKQRSQALVQVAPQESRVGFKGKSGKIDGVPISELTSDQKAHAKEVLLTLLEPYRDADRTEAAKVLDAQGGLEACRLSFYRQMSDGTSLDLGNDGEWDVWRLEGPAFVWHFRGVPHVHVWVNIADDPSVALNARG